MSVEAFAAELARRIPEMAKDSVVNNETLIKNLLWECLTDIAIKDIKRLDLLDSIE